MLRFLACLLACATAGFAQDVARLNQLAEAQAAGDKFMGSVLVAKGDTILFEQSYGWANMEWRQRHTSDTKFRIGSVTKQFTAAAILLLEERGKLRTDDPVSKHMPDSPAAWEQVTLYHLLAHTSGIPSLTGFPEFRTFKLSPATPEKLVQLFRDKPLEFTPGERFNYSNSGYVLLGYLVGRISGQSYATFIRENLLKPLGMTDTGCDSNTTVIPHRAAGYSPGPTGLSNAAYVDMSVPLGAGDLYSTPRDLHRWARGIFGGKLLSAESLRKMTTPNKGDYAGGVSVRTISGHKAIAHNGGIEGFHSHLAYYPDEQVTIVVLANVNSPAPDILSGQLARVVFGETITLPSERVAMALPEATLRSYVGVYQFGRGTMSVRYVDGELTTQLSGQRPVPIFAESETKFFAKVVDAQIGFFKDADGRVTHLVLYQNGREQKAPRISDTVVERKAIELDRAVLERYVGRYAIEGGGELTVAFVNGRFIGTAKMPGRQWTAPLFAESETKFFLQPADLQVEFFRDANGAVTHAVIRQGTQETKATRKET